MARLIIDRVQLGVGQLMVRSRLFLFDWLLYLYTKFNLFAPKFLKNPINLGNPYLNSGGLVYHLVRE